MRLLLIAGCLAAFGCDGDAFVNPPEADLWKAPYDFSISRPDVDMAVPDQHPDLLVPSDGP